MAVPVALAIKVTLATLYHEAVPALASLRDAREKK